MTWQVMVVRRMQGPSHHLISADQLLPSREPQVHTERAGKAEGEEQHTRQRQGEDGSHFAARAQQRACVHCLFALVVMPLDGEERARTEDEDFERNEDYGDPIDHFENFQPRTRH